MGSGRTRDARVTGAYATNGSVLAVFRRSGDRVVPDLFCVAFLGSFKGYAPGYSRDFVQDTNCLTWAVLKAHTNNRAGSVSLRCRRGRRGA